LTDILTVVINAAPEAGTVSIATLAVKWLFDMLRGEHRRQRLENPVFEDALSQRDAADKRANELWERNLELERTLAKIQREYADERTTLYEKLDAFSQALAAAREEITALSVQVSALQSQSKTG
jgi:hypothetical protein